MVVRDHDYYVGLVSRITNDPLAYEEVDADVDNKLLKKIDKFVGDHSGELTDGEMTVLTKFEHKASNQYGLRKVHKSKIIDNAIVSQQSEIICTSSPKDLDR